MQRDNIIGTLHTNEHMTGGLSPRERLTGYGSVGGGVSSYNELTDLPTLNGETIIGNMTTWQPFDFDNDNEFALGFKYKNKDLYMKVLKSSLIPADTTLASPALSNVDDYFIISIKSIDSSQMYEYSPCYISMYNYQGSGTNYGMMQYDKTNHILQFSNMSRVNQLYIEALVIYTKI